MVELVDTLDLGSSAERCESSSLSVRTKYGFVALLAINSRNRAARAALFFKDSCNMVGVAQLVEHGIVTPVVEGSIPFVHPIFKKRQINNLAFLYQNFEMHMQWDELPHWIWVSAS